MNTEIKNIISSNDILNFFDNKQIDDGWSFAEYKASETGKWTHDYHRYPAKFIPQLVEALIDKYIQNNYAHINDPFMGCGTTIDTRISRGIVSSGADVNDIAHLITKVKTTPINPDKLEKKINELLEKIDSFNSSQQTLSNLTNNDDSPFIPSKHLDRINYWFREENKYELGYILKFIYEENDVDTRNFFLVGFSHILKNCSIWLQTSTKPTRDFKKKPSKPSDAFRRQIKRMKKGNDKFYDIVPKEVKENLNDYLNIKIDHANKQPVPDDSVDLIVSSSPYVTSYEYADLHQLSTIWLDFTDDLKEYRRKFIGSSYKKPDNGNLKSEIAQEIVSEMNSKSNKMAKEVEAFFIDIENVFKESYRILKPGGRCCFVIGNTKLKGVNVLNAEVFSESLQYAGFKFDNLIKREIPSKILPQKRDEKTGKFASSNTANSEAYPVEYIVIGLKE